MILRIRSQLFLVLLAISRNPARPAICAEGQNHLFTSEDGKTSTIASSARLIGIPLDQCRKYCEGNQLRDNSELACVGFAYKWTTKTCQLYTDPSLAVSLVDGVNSVIYRKECADPDTEIITGPGPPEALSYEVLTTGPANTLTDSLLSAIPTKTPASALNVLSTKYVPATTPLVGQTTSSSTIPATSLAINITTTVKPSTTPPTAAVTTAKLTPATTSSTSNGLKVTVYPTGSFTIAIRANETTVAAVSTVKSQDATPTVKPAQATFQLPASIASTFTTTTTTPTKAGTFAPATSTVASTMAAPSATPAAVPSPAVAIATVIIATTPPSAAIAPTTVRSATTASLPITSATHAPPVIASSTPAPASAVLTTSKPAPITSLTVVTTTLPLLSSFSQLTSAFAPASASLTMTTVMPTLPPFSPATMSLKPIEPSTPAALSQAISLPSMNSSSLTLSTSAKGDQVGLLVDPRLIVPITAELPIVFLPEGVAGQSNSAAGGLQFPSFLRWPNYDPRWAGEVLRGGGFDTCRLSESFMECWRREKQKQIEVRRKHQEEVRFSKKKRTGERPRGYSN